MRKIRERRMRRLWSQDAKQMHDMLNKVMAKESPTKKASLTEISFKREHP